MAPHSSDRAPPPTPALAGAVPLSPAVSTALLALATLSFLEEY